MAVTRRGYIFGAFLSGVLSVLLIVVALASDSWVSWDFFFIKCRNYTYFFNYLINKLSVAEAITH